MKNSPVRQKIIETASELFYQKGYSLTGINEIIEEADIAKATLYHHFRSKEDICVAYLEHMNTQFLQDLEEFVRKADEGKEQILAIFEFLIHFFNDKEFNGCWCINTVSEVPRENEKVRAEIQHQKDRFLWLIEQLLKDNLPDNSLEKNKSLARQIYLLYEGAIAESHLHREVWPIESAKTIVNQIL